ncbi:MAG: hypothetical protein Q9225_000229 [Loekoesia sp. 1 TL-2023]
MRAASDGKVYSEEIDSIAPQEIIAIEPETEMRDEQSRLAAHQTEGNAIDPFLLLFFEADTTVRDNNMFKASLDSSEHRPFHVAGRVYKKRMLKSANLSASPLQAVTTAQVAAQPSAAGISNSMAASHQSLKPTVAVTEVSEAYVGKKLQDVPTPAAIVDRAIVRRNCTQMLQACEALACSFRPHVKTHKVLYGIPVPPSSVRQLAQLGRRLHPGSVSVLLDHPDQLQHLKIFEEIAGYRLLLYIKIDTGYHRAGIMHESSQFSQLVSSILPEGADLPYTEFCGLYSHAGHSYGGSSPDEAMNLLTEEIRNLQLASGHIRKMCPATVRRPMILSVGATPTATSIQNMANHGNNSSQHTLRPGQADVLIQHINDIKAKKDFLEIHAGVYPFLDLQQLATQASPSASTASAISTHDIAMTILAEVASLYNARDEREALIAAGSLALGREPCKSYEGWGIVSDWNINSQSTSKGSCWQVGRVSQEHGILKHRLDSLDDLSELYVGQKLRIFPNHACIAGANFGWYCVVDSDLPDERQDEVVEIWIRCRGW